MGGAVEVTIHNLTGADLSILQRDVLDYRSCVIPPPSCRSSEGTQMTDRQLLEVLGMVCCLLWPCKSVQGRLLIDC